MIPDIPYFTINGENGEKLYQIEGQQALLNESEFSNYKQELGQYGRLKGIEPSSEQRAGALKSIQTMIEDRFLNQYPDDMDRAVQEASDAFNEYKEPGYKKRMAGDQAFEELLAKAYTEVDPMLWNEADELQYQQERVMLADEARYGGMDNIPYDPKKYFKTSSQSKSAESKRNQQILATGQAPKAVPYDSFMAEDMNYRSDRPGIDGKYQPGSEVRVHTVKGNASEPNLEGNVPIIRRTNVWTEMPSQAGLEKLYDDFKVSAAEHNRKDKRFAAGNSIEAFNRTLAEYYGQQGLLLSGRTPVSDAERSDGVKRRAQRGDATAMGTNRLIEQTRGMNDDEVFFEKDYRYKDKDGRVIVGDSQTLPSANGRSNYVWGDIFNAARLDSSLSENEGIGLKRAIMDKAADVRSRGGDEGMDRVIKELIEEDVLPDINSVGNIKSGKQQGVALGKATGKSKIFSKDVNLGNNPNQKELDEIIFSELPTNFKTKIGARPINMTIVDTEGMNRAMIDPTILNERAIQHWAINDIETVNPNLPPSQQDQKGKTRMRMDTKRLAARGIAKQLLPKTLMDQLK